MFEKDGEILQILRIADPENPRGTVSSDDDMGVSLILTNTTTGTQKSGEDAQQYILNHILPKDLTRFFFIDGSLSPSTGLISNKGKRSHQEEHRDILNFPVLKKGISDLESVRGISWRS